MGVLVNNNYAEKSLSPGQILDLKRSSKQSNYINQQLHLQRSCYHGSWL